MSYHESKGTLGERIEKARQASGLSTAQISKRMSVQAKTVVNWESDRSEPRANQLTMLAGVLGVPVLWLLHGDEFDHEGPRPTKVDAAQVIEKMNRLVDLNQQVNVLIAELQQDVQHLQD